MPVFSRSDWVLLLPLAAAAVLLLAGNDNFGFDPPGYLDPFFYVSYFWHYAEHLPFLEVYYKLSRLPWVLPGFAAHSLAGPVGGTFILVFTTAAGGATAMYLLVRDATTHRTVAALVASAWACCTWGHGPGGFSYHIVGAVAYYVAACWSALRAARTGSSTAAVLGGAFLACAIHTHLFLVVFTPLLALFHLTEGSVSLRKRLRQLAAHGMLALGGGVAATVVLSVINGLTGGTWLFFLPQIEYTLWLGQGSNNTSWIADPAQWMSGALYLVLPLLFLPAGLAVAGARHDANRRTLWVLVAQAWIALGILAFFQFARRQTLLDHNYQAFVLYAHAFPSMAAALVARSRPGRLGSGSIAAVGTAAILVPLLLLLPSPLPQWGRTMVAAAGMASGPPIVAPLLAGLAATAVTLACRGSTRLLVFAGWFGLMNAWIVPDATNYGIGTPGYRREMLELFYEADRLTSRLDPSLLGIKYWMVQDEIDAAGSKIKATDVFESYLSTRSWRDSMLAPNNLGLPIETVSAEQALLAPCIAVLSSLRHQDEWRERATAHFTQMGIPLRLIASERFERPDIGFALTVFSTTSRGHTDDDPPPCEP